METHYLEEAKQFFTEGQQYLDTALGSIRKGRFTHELNYQFLSMSVEKFIMSILFYHDIMAEHHTLAFLSRQLLDLNLIEKPLHERLKKLDNLQAICLLDAYKRMEPTEEQIEDFKAIAESIAELAKTFSDIK